MSSLPFTYLPPYNPLSTISSSSSLSSTKQESTQSIHPSLLRRTREKKMSIARTYALARTARGKLSAEASKHNHDLRLLVGHANMLDSLMMALAEAERAQEEWFNEAIRGNMADEEESLEEEVASHGEGAQPWPEADYESDSDSEMSEDEEDSDIEFEYEVSSKPPSMPYQTIIGITEAPQDSEDYDDEEGDQDGLYALTRTTSHRPPQLVQDDSDDSDEESNPPSPPQVLLSSFPTQEKDSLPPSNFFDQLPPPPRLPSRESEPYFRSEYYPSASIIDSF